MSAHGANSSGISRPVFVADSRWTSGGGPRPLRTRSKERPRRRADRSIWDTFADSPGRIANGDRADRATDHYHHYAADVALMREVGPVRLPVLCRLAPGPAGWPGRHQPAGLAFYDRLVDELLAADIVPTATLYHWDLPQELEDAGGWTHRDTAERFADYAAAVGARLGDRVRTWFTLNEPWCSAFLGYGSGNHAPGRVDPAASLAAAHHLMLAHGHAVQALRGAGATGAISVALNAGAVRPVTASPGDLDAARRIDGLLEPDLPGTDPLWTLPGRRGRRRADDHGLVFRQTRRPGGHPGAHRHARASTTTNRIWSGAASTPAASTPYPGCEDITFHPVPGPVTEMGWSVDPSGLRDLLVRFTGTTAWATAVCR